jgi:hypothetical protein
MQQHPPHMECILRDMEILQRIDMLCIRAARCLVIDSPGLLMQLQMLQQQPNQVAWQQQLQQNTVWQQSWNTQVFVLSSRHPRDRIAVHFVQSKVPLVEPWILSHYC